MERSPSIVHLAKGLLAFQATATKITKDAINPHFKSKYASLSSILDEIAAPLAAAGLALTQLPEGDEDLVTMLIHAETGEFLQSTYKISAVQKTPQAMGSAITYARRYALSAILSLNIDEDDDGNAASGNAASGNAAKKQGTTTAPPAQSQPVQQQPAAAPPAPNLPPPPSNSGVATGFDVKYSSKQALLAALAIVKTKDDLKRLFLANEDNVKQVEELSAAFQECKERLLTEERDRYSQHYQSATAVVEIEKLLAQAPSLQLIESLFSKNGFLMERDPHLYKLMSDRIKYFNDKAAQQQAKAAQTQPA